jgi:hypothetical protein
MPKIDPRVDAYIDEAADFARPILKEIRAGVHEACPACEETMKWHVRILESRARRRRQQPHARFRHLTSVADLQPEPQVRIRRVDHRGEAPRDAGQAR